MSELPTDPKEVQADSQETAQEKPFEEAFEDLFPMDKFNRSIGYTKQGSTEGVEDITQEFIIKLLSGELNIGVIKFQKLPDGGYQINSYNSNE